jgi:hypothetical protein
MTDKSGSVRCFGIFGSLDKVALGFNFVLESNFLMESTYFSHSPICNLAVLCTSAGGIISNRVVRVRLFRFKPDICPGELCGA